MNVTTPGTGDSPRDSGTGVLTFGSCLDNGTAGRRVSGDSPDRIASRRLWVALVMGSTLLAVVVLFVVHALTPAWISATGAALSVWALTNAIGSTLIRRRQDRR